MKNKLIEAKPHKICVNALPQIQSDLNFKLNFKWRGFVGLSDINEIIMCAVNRIGFWFKIFSNKTQ